MSRDVAVGNVTIRPGLTGIVQAGYPQANEIYADYQQSKISLPGMPGTFLGDIAKLAENYVVMQLQIFNQSSKEITVVYRGGERDVIPPIQGHYTGEIILRRILINHKKNNARLDKFYFDQDNDKHPPNSDFAIHKRQYIDARKFGNSNHIVGITDAVVLEKDLDQNKSMYIHVRDIVLSYEDVCLAPPHPFDKVEASIERSELFLKQKTGTGSIIEIIDSTGKVGLRYGHMFGQILTINPIKDPIRADGVYLYETDSNNKIIHRTFSLEEAEKQSILYRTHEEAETAIKGGFKLHYEKEIETMKLENKKQQVLHDKEKNDYEIHVNKIKRENSTLEAEFKKRLLEMEEKFKSKEQKAGKEKVNLSLKDEKEKSHQTYNEHRRRDHYDERSTRRKDFGEIIKFWPVLVTGIIAAGTYFVKK